MAQGAAAARRPVRIWQVTLAAALVLAATLAGCSKPAPGPTPSPSTSAASPTTTSSSPAPSPSPTPPPTPATWGNVDGAAAVDAAIYFKSLYNYALETGDLVEWRALSDPNCQFCKGVADDIGATYAAGSHYEGGEVTLTESVVVEYSQALGIYGVQHTYTSTASTTVANDGTRRDASPAESGFVVFDVVPAKAGWLLVEVRQHDAPLPSLGETAP